MKIFSAAILLFLLLAPAAGRGGGEKAKPVPFHSPEQLVYEGEFSKLMLRGINIVELRFTANRPPAPPATDSPAAPTLLLTGEVNSKGWFSKLFGLHFRYRVESTVEADSFAVVRTTKLDEQGKRVRTSEAVFDRAGRTITWTERDPHSPERPPRVVTSQFDGALHDIISALYFLRTQKLTPGQSIDLPLSDSGAVYHVPAKVGAAKRLKTALGELRAVRVDVGVFGPGRLVDDKGEFSIWFTDDARHLPVRARINTDFGTLDLNLKKVAG